MGVCVESPPLLAVLMLLEVSRARKVQVFDVVRGVKRGDMLWCPRATGHRGS